MKTSTILGAKPQFIKAALSRAIAQANSNKPTNHQSLNLYGGGKASEKIIKKLLEY